MRSRAHVDPDRPEKRCPSCQTVKVRADFYKNSHAKDGMSAMCKPCWQEVTKNRRLLYRYGIDEDQYAAMSAEQGGLCFICSSPPPGAKRLYVDHDHSTGKVRRLLCPACNFLAGHVEASPDRFLGVIAYLRDHGSEGVQEVAEALAIRRG